MSRRVSVDAFPKVVSNTLASINVDPDLSDNFMAQLTAPGNAKSPIYGRTTPGLRPWVVLSDSPIRAEFQQDGRAFVVAGGQFFEVFSGGSFTSYGNVDEDDFQASICSNGSAGNQLLIVSGGKGYVFDLNANTLGSALGGDFPDNVRQCAFLDGYGIVSVADSRHWQISALEDFTSWDALDFAERSIASDNIVAMIRLNRLIWFLGSKTTEIWYDSGDPLFPFQPTSQTLIEHGAAAPFAVCSLNDTLFLLGLDEQGSAVVWRYEGYVPTRISTLALEQDIAQTGTAPDNDFILSVACTYQEQGSFFVLQCPTATKTWVFDTSTNLWHTRFRCVDGFSETVPSPISTHMYAFGKHLMGDRASGAIYDQQLAYFDEQIVP